MLKRISILAVAGCLFALVFGTTSVQPAFATETYGFSVGDNEIVFHHERPADDWFEITFAGDDGEQSGEGGDWYAADGDYHFYPSADGTYTVAESLHTASITRHFNGLSSELSALSSAFAQYTEGSLTVFSSGVDVPAAPGFPVYLAVYRDSGTASVLQAKKVIDWGNIVDDELIVSFPSLPGGSYKWRVESDAGSTSRWDRFTRKTPSAVTLSSSKTVVTYGSHRVTFSGKLLVGGKAAASRYVWLCRDGSHFKKLKTDKYGKVRTVVSVRGTACEWQLTYPGGSSVDSAASSHKHTRGLYEFYDTGNLLEYPALHSGRTYQVILLHGYRVDLTAPRSRQVFHRYSTFTFRCRATGSWKFYAANHDIFAGQEVRVVIW